MNSRIKRSKRICFISRTIHYITVDGGKRYMGGSELQQIILAEGLSEKNWEVYFVTERIKGVKKYGIYRNRIHLYNSLNFSYGNKYVRKFILPITLIQALERIDANIYYQRNPDYLTGFISIYCKIKKKKFFVAGASNWNFNKGKERNLNHKLDRLSCRLGINFANDVIVQNKIQLDYLKKNYKKNGKLFYNVFSAKKRVKSGNHILWVGRIESYKRPLWCLELAKRLAEYKFVMVGGRGSDNELCNEVIEKVEKEANILYLGHQPFEKVERLFDDAAIFLCTYHEEIEGFPNTFLQAWSRGIPVVSSMDIDGLIAKNNLGRVSKTINEMEKSIRKIKSELANSGNKYEHIYRFFIENFYIKYKIKDLENLFLNT